MRNPIVIGRRVYLRPFELDDADEMAAALSRETETGHDHGRMPESPLSLRTWLESVTATPGAPPTEIGFAVCMIGPPDPDRLIGGVNIDHIDWLNRTGETGIGLFPAAARGQGYGTEAKHLILEYAFDQMHFHAMKSHVWEPNTRSAAALAKQGYRPAGRVRWDMIQRGVFRDSLVFDVLREDWIAARDAWLAERSDHA